MMQWWKDASSLFDVIHVQRFQSDINLISQWH